MTKEERLAKQNAQIENMIDRFNMTEKCGMSREDIHKKIRRSMVLNNFAFILADVANTFLMDMEEDLKPFGVAFEQTDKYNFKQMLSHVTAARKWAEKSALPIYKHEDIDNACADSDWWYSFIKLVDDRTGDNRQKTNMLLEYLLNMPSEMNMFNIKYNDFKRFKK